MRRSICGAAFARSAGILQELCMLVIVMCMLHCRACCCDSLAITVLHLRAIVLRILSHRAGWPGGEQGSTRCERVGSGPGHGEGFPCPDESSSGCCPGHDSRFTSHRRSFGPSLDSEGESAGLMFFNVLQSSICPAQHSTQGVGRHALT